MLRGFAAFYVFAGHVLLERVLQKQSGLGFLFRFGQEAVMLFFLISGFVVYYSTSKHGDTSFSSYFARRARRIYPIFLLALILSWACAAQALGRLPDFSMKQWLGNLLMLQELQNLKGGQLGGGVAPLHGNFPLWSLSYEWWFYVLFYPVYRFIPAARRLHVVAGLSLIGFVTFSLHPNQVSSVLWYFILWWVGAELARSRLERVPLTFVSQRRSLAYLTLFCALAGGAVLAAVIARTPLAFGIHPVLEFRHFCACLIFLAAGLLWSRARWIGFDRLFAPFAFFAPISYAIYVFHFPLAVSSSYLAFLPFPALQIAGYVLVTLVAAYLAEVPFQNWINRVLRRSRPGKG